MGIAICGLNGSGKSTLGKALADKLAFHFIDNEDLFFSKTDAGYLFASPRTRAEAEALLTKEISAHENFVFAAVRGDYGEAVLPLYQYAVLVDVPRDVRLRRVRQRSYQKFGPRMLPGGDLYESEERFFAMVAARPERYVEDWALSLTCPVIRVDGTKPTSENVALILERMRDHPPIR